MKKNLTKKIATEEKPKEIVKSKTQDELRDLIKNMGTIHDAQYIIPKAEEETKGLNKNKYFDSKSYLYKSMTLFEFNNGVLMSSSIPERFMVFALEFSRNLQKEFNCVGPSEQSVAEIVSLNYVRVLEIQRKINNLFDQGGLKKLEVQ